MGCTSFDESMWMEIDTSNLNENVLRRVLFTYFVENIFISSHADSLLTDFAHFPGQSLFLKNLTDVLFN